MVIVVDEKYINWENFSVMRHNKAMISDIIKENERLKKRIKELEKENYILSITVQRNESYIKRLMTKGKWSNTGDVK